jgi:signal transduction histidine kinase
MIEEKSNILLVDDRPENLLSLEAVLQELGQNLVKAHSGAEALRRVLKQDFAVILLDVQMPGMDGFETADLIKERDRSRYTPIIFITALSKSDNFVARGYSVGAVDYIFKPIVPEVLRSKVSVFVDLYKMTAHVKRMNEELERRVLERTAQLEAANRDLEIEIAERKRLEQQKDEFLAVASHELRTPLTAIKAYAQVALNAVSKMGDERTTRSLRIVAEKSDQLAQLISEMLDVSRIEHGILPLQREPFDLSELVNEVVGSLQLTAPDFTFNMDVPAAPAIVNADRLRIEQVVANLIENAVKYTSKLSRDNCRIEISVRQGGDEVIASVQDHGVGIPADQQPKVFSRFFRASNVTSARYPYPGMGLGLFISHDIISRHGGRIWVESTGDQGSTFSFALPSASAGERELEKVGQKGRDNIGKAP